MKYRKIAIEFFEDESRMTRTMEEFQYNLLHMLRVDLEEFTLQSKSLAMQTLEQLKQSGKEHILGITAEQLEQISEEEQDFKEWRKLKPATGWKANIYKSFKSNILKEGLALKDQELALETMLGLLDGLMEELEDLGLRNDSEEADLNLGQIKNNLLQALDRGGKARFARGYSKGLLFHCGEDGGEFFEKTDTTTSFYLVLLIFADIVDDLKTRQEVVDFLREIMGNKLLQSDETLHKSLYRLGLKGRKDEATS